MPCRRTASGRLAKSLLFSQKPVGWQAFYAPFSTKFASRLPPEQAGGFRCVSGTLTPGPLQKSEPVAVHNARNIGLAVTPAR